MEKEFFVKTISSLEQALQDNPNTLFLRPRKSLQKTGGMTLQLQEAEWKPDNLRKTVRDMIADYVNYSDDPQHRTAHLKNTNQPGTMLLDGLKSRLEDFFFLECMLVDKNNLIYHFKDPLDVQAIETLANNSLLGRVNVEHKKTRSGRDVSELFIDGVLVLSIDLYNVKMNYANLVNQDKFSLGFQASTELVTRIHQDRLLDGNRRKIYLSNYQPVFKLVSPEAFEDKISQALKEIRQLSLSGDLPKHPDFVETRMSKRVSSNKVYRPNAGKIVDHLEYLAICPDKKEMYVKFGCNFDYDAIKDMLKREGFRLDDAKEISAFKSITIKKGGGSRKRTWSSTKTKRDILDEEGNLLLSLSDKDSLKISFDGSEESFNKAAKIFGNIYYERLFYTGWVNTSELKSDLTKEERIVISSLEPLVQFYTLFLEVEEAQTAMAQGKKFLFGPQGWVNHRLIEAGNVSFEERVLHVLNYMDSKVDPDTFYKHGKEQSTQERLRTYYSALQNLKGRFEALTIARKAGQLK
ncbi:hypothetical protein HZA97_07790 [Candidatus Woesearchaeota archaeon]|nr:hypothetical protein [Candidatus Woesearchaeota archaeon]